MRSDDRTRTVMLEGWGMLEHPSLDEECMNEFFHSISTATVLISRDAVGVLPEKIPLSAAGINAFSSSCGHSFLFLIPLSTRDRLS
jgi:hypothetical protein